MQRLPLFDDRIISSSDSNRRTGEVLHYAAEHPVTITRNEGDLVLMKRRGPECGCPRLADRRAD